MIISSFRLSYLYRLFSRKILALSLLLQHLIQQCGWENLHGLLLIPIPPLLQVSRCINSKFLGLKEISLLADLIQFSQTFSTLPYQPATHKLPLFELYRSNLFIINCLIPLIFFRSSTIFSIFSLYLTKAFFENYIPFSRSIFSCSRGEEATGASLPPFFAPFFSSFCLS